MSPTPVTFTSPVLPTAYAWEATNEQVAERYGVPIDSIVRFDLNTSPTPPALVDRLLAAGQFDTPLSEYPPSDYRRLTDAAAARYGVGTDELLVGAGADEILDLVAKAFLTEGSRAVLPAPTYAMYRVLTEQRGAEVVTVPRRPPAEGWALDIDSVRAAARGSSVVWLCSPNNPTGLAEPDGTIEALLAGLASDAETTEPCRRSSCSTRRTRSSSGRRSCRSATRTRGSSSCARRAKPMPSPGCASGSRSRGPRSSPA